MSSYPGDPRDPRRGSRPGAQGASRGGFRPDDAANDIPPPPGGDDVPRRGAGPDGAPFGGYPFNGQQSRGWGDQSSAGRGGATFLGLPVKLIYAMGGALLAIVLIGAVCGRPTANGSVAGQVNGLNADKTIVNLAGAQLTLNGAGKTFTATSTDVSPGAEGEAAYNYRFQDVPPGTYALTVTPPAGAPYQPEENITFEVKSGQLYPQSVMLLAQGMQKPRALAQNELQPGESAGYINERGERVVYQQGSGFDSSDALLMYLLWRNPPMWGYGAPPVIIHSPGGTTTGSNYRVADPPTRSSSGQTVTQQRPTTPGQGSTRPSSGAPATGSGPSYSSGSGSSSSGSSSRDTDVNTPSQNRPSTSSGSSSGSSSSTQTRPSTSTGSQGASRPSSSSSSPSRSSAPSRSSGSSGGGRR